MADASGAAAAEASGLVETLQGHVDDLRSILQCGICIRPLYEPFTLACGHTFCYSCLSSWFSGGKSKRTCPDCRAPVKQQPAPAYLVRAVVQMFTSRAELLDKEETTDDHKKSHQEETERLDKDKSNEDPQHGGLFGGLFRRTPPLKPIVDVEDGVVRCPECSWELDPENHCASCGYQEGNELDTEESDSDLSETDYDDSIFDGDGFEEDDFEESENIMDAWPYSPYLDFPFPGPRGLLSMPLPQPMNPYFPHIETAHAHWRARRPAIPHLHGYDDEEEDEEELEDDDDYEMDSFIDDEDPVDDGDLNPEQASDSDHSTVVGSERNRQVPVVHYPSVPQRSHDDIESIDDSSEISTDSYARNRYIGSGMWSEDDEEEEEEEEEEDLEDEDEYDSEDEMPQRRNYRTHVPDSISPPPEDESEATSSSSPPRPRQTAISNGTSRQDAIAIDDSDDEQPVGPMRRAAQRRQTRFSPY